MGLFFFKPDVKKLKALGNIKRLIKELKNKDVSIRESVVEALWQLKDPRAVDPLIALLKDNDVNVRYSAARLLGYIGDSRATEPLIAALKDDNSDVRRVAADFLGKIKDSRSIESLWATLRNGCSTPDERLAVMYALAQLKSFGIIEVIREKNKDIRQRMAWCLKRSHWCPKTDYEKVLLYIAEKRFDKCIKLREAAIEPLIDELQDCNQYEPWLPWLSEQKDPRLVEPFIALLQNERRVHDVRMYAAKGLGKQKDYRAVEPLIAVLTDENLDVRGQAVVSLGEIGDLRAVDPLVALLKNCKRLDRYYLYSSYTIISVLRKLNYTGLVELLIDVLFNKDTLRSIAAADHLGDMNDPRAVEPLIATYRNRDDSVILPDSCVDPQPDITRRDFLKFHALRALARMKDPRLLEFFISELKQQVLILLNPERSVLEDLVFPRIVVEALYKMRYPPIVECINKAILSLTRFFDYRKEESDMESMYFEDEFSEFFIFELKIQNSDIQKIAEVRDLIGFCEIVGYLRVAVNDENETVRETAKRVLDKLRPIRTWKRYFG